MESFLNNLQKCLAFRILSADFFIRPLYMMAFSSLHSLGPETMREYGHYRLRLLLAHAHRNVPYWRDIIGPDLLTDPLDMATFVRLPVLTRELLVENDGNLLVRNLGRYNYQQFVTSGSTGKPKQFLAEEIFCQKFIATEAFYVDFFGLKNFKQYGFLLYKPHLKKFTSQISAFDDTYKVNAFFEQHDIRAVGGALHNVLRLAEMIESGNVTANLSFVGSGSEFLSSETKQYLEDIFHCPIYNRYVCAEAGVLGVECTDRGGFHIDPVNCYLEIVDDQGAPITDGSVGRILITVFNNRLMPLIRYELGDTGHWIADTEKCSCGLQTPRLFFEGRTLEYVRFPDGRKYSALSLIRRIDYRFFGAIAKQQIIQESLGKLIIKIVPGKHYRTEYKIALHKYVAGLFRDSPNIKMEVQEVLNIDNLKNGKYSIFESRI